jgi:hypothetical protein
MISHNVGSVKRERNILLPRCLSIPLLRASHFLFFHQRLTNYLQRLMQPGESANISNRPAGFSAHGRDVRSAETGAVFRLHAHQSEVLQSQLIHAP